MSRTAYVVEQGVYDSAHLVAVYATEAQAMGAYPNERWVRTTYLGCWANTHLDNTKDWDNALRIYPIDLIEDGPERNADEEKVYRDAGGKWELVV